MPTLALPVAAWSEPPSVANAPLTRLVPYLTTDGWWRYLAPGDAIPVGAVQGAAVDDGAGGVTLEVPAVPGLRPIMNLGGSLFLMNG